MCAMWRTGIVARTMTRRTLALAHTRSSSPYILFHNLLHPRVPLFEFNSAGIQLWTRCLYSSGCP